MQKPLILGALSLSLAACGSLGTSLEDMRLASEQNAGVCPNAFALDDAARMIDFDGEPALDNVAWSAEIVDVRTACRYVSDRPIMAMVEIDFEVGRGPAAESQLRELSYFVAVTRRNRELIAKETFVVPVEVKGGIATVTLTDTVDSITIPRKAETVAGSNFEIAVGLTLDRSQVIYNRSGRSLRFKNL